MHNHEYTPQNHVLNHVADKHQRPLSTKYEDNNDNNYNTNVAVTSHQITHPSLKFRIINSLAIHRLAWPILAHATYEFNS